MGKVYLSYVRFALRHVLKRLPNYQESYNNHKGYVDVQGLKNYLEDQRKDYEKYYKIAFMHHTPYTFTDDIGSTLNNWSDVSTLLESEGFNFFMFGHIHTGDVKGIKEQEMSYYSIVGSFSKIIDNNDYNNEFNFFVEVPDGEEGMKFHVYNYIYLSKHKDWQIVDVSKNTSEIFLREPKIDEDTEKKVAQILNMDEEGTDTTIEKPIGGFVINYGDEFSKTELDLDYNKSILSIVKENHLFKSGHFHWGENSRSHGWINTNKLLSSSYIRIYIRLAMKKIIEAANIYPEIIIGIGMEGSILGCQLMPVYDNAKYIYYPLNSHGHNNHEMKIENNEEAKSVLLVTDVVYQCNTIKKMIEDQESFFSGVEDINVVSIFYSGELKYSSDMFSKNEVDEFVDERIKLFRLCDMKIQPCPYKSIGECEVYLNDLDTIYTYYEGGSLEDENC